MSEDKIKVGISQGDINGIGMEVIIKSFLDPAIFDLCTPIVFSSQKTVSFHRKLLNQEEFSFHLLREGEEPSTKKANLRSCYEEEVQIEPGKSTPLGGQYSVRSLEAACDALDKGEVDVLVTAPIDKHNVQGEHFNFPGHTEYLQKRYGNPGALMLLVSDVLKVGVVTGHIPLTEVAAAVTTEKIIEKLVQLQDTLMRDFGIRKPKIAVLGLNPHAGDQGTIGKEDAEIIQPAVQKTREMNMMVWGPFPADGFFGNASYAKYDAVLCMYHDQGLIPFKTIAFESGVNFTAGLKIVRTSPDHGTAFDIAGKNVASEESFRRALYMACDIFRKRREYAELNADPLKITQLKRERN